MLEVKFCSAQDGIIIYALGKRHHMRSSPTLLTFPKVAWGTVSLSLFYKEGRVSFFPLLSGVLCPEDRRALHLFKSLSSRISMAWWPWLCARSYSVSSISKQSLIVAVTAGDMQELAVTHYFALEFLSWNEFPRQTSRRCPEKAVRQ